MDFSQITKSNMDTLYDLNRQLAVDEGQGDLFTADRKDYADALLCDDPAAFGFLCFLKGKAVGFYLYYYKFATYLGSRVFYIEDIYLIHDLRTRDNKVALIQHALEQSRIKACDRVEMRVFRTFNLGYDVMKDMGFNKINKWDVFRREYR